MTRQEFFDNITTWWELKEFCYDNECGICDDIYDEDARDSYIEDLLEDWVRNQSWHSVLSRLQDIPEGYEYYLYDDEGEWIGLNDDEDFDEYRESVARWMDNGDFWDEEEPDEDDVDEEPLDEELQDEEDDTPVDEEDCSIGELIVTSVSCLRTISEEAKRREEEETKAFSSFLNSTIAFKRPE